MSGHPPRPRRVDPGCARDCIRPREDGRLHIGANEIHKGGRRRSSPARRREGSEGTEDLLRQLPAALGGNRPPANVSAAQPRPPVSAPRSAERRQRVQRRAASVDGPAQHPLAPRVDSAEHERQARGQGGGGQQRRPPSGVDVAPGALTVDFRALPRHTRPQRVEPPWGVDDSSMQPHCHAQDGADAQPHPPDARHKARGGRGGGGRDSPFGGAFPGQRRVQSDSPGCRMQGRATPDAGKRDRLACSVSKAADANSQFRPYMEDRCSVVDPFMPAEAGSGQWAFYAVYDGHGGSQAAELCDRELHIQLSIQLLRAMREQRTPGLCSDEAVADALTRTFQVMDEQLLKIGAYGWGTTATVALVHRSRSGLRLHVANVGDSRALAIDNSKRHVRVSQDHRPSDESEARRVRQAGGYVQMGRVSGVLAVSRALGDHTYKGAGVTWRPTITVRDASDDMALVIGSDGLWDYLGDDDVRAVIEAGAHDREFDLAPRLVGDAKRCGSTDNTCCLAIFW